MLWSMKKRRERLKPRKNAVTIAPGDSWWRGAIRKGLVVKADVTSSGLAAKEMYFRNIMEMLNLCPCSKRLIFLISSFTILLEISHKNIHIFQGLYKLFCKICLCHVLPMKKCKCVNHILTLDLLKIFSFLEMLW